MTIPKRSGVTRGGLDASGVFLPRSGNGCNAHGTLLLERVDEINRRMVSLRKIRQTALVSPSAGE